MSGATAAALSPGTIGEVLAAAAARLAAAGIAEPRREARLIVAFALGLEPATILGWPERTVAPETATRIAQFVARRARGEPFSRLKGRREFWSLDFALSPDTLDPRADSETLVAAALDDVGDRSTKLRLLDFGTGTGCLLLALLSELPQARGLGIDIAPGAIATAKLNAEALGLAARADFRLGGWDSGIDGAADVILTNPPYIRTSEIERLPPEVVVFDPVVALDGGADGLVAYRALGPAIRRSLAAGGRAYIEIGVGQAWQVARIFVETGLTIVTVRRDLAGIERCLVATL